jgi:hypothetical protein
VIEIHGFIHELYIRETQKEDNDCQTVFITYGYHDRT